jgi:hypothetical protein
MPTSSPITPWMACCNIPRHLVFYVKLHLVDLMIYLPRFAKMPDGRESPLVQATMRHRLEITNVKAEHCKVI